MFRRALYTGRRLSTAVLVIGIGSYFWKDRRFNFPVSSTCEPVDVDDGRIIVVNGSSVFQSGLWVTEIDVDHAGTFLYEGDTARDGTPQGFGKLTAPDGITYHGRFERGTIVEGKMKIKKDTVYEGPFLNWAPHGLGRLHDRYGNSEGKFEYGKFPHTFKTYLRYYNVSMEVTQDSFLWQTRRFTITAPGQYTVTGKYPCKDNAWKGTKVYENDDILEECGTFTTVFLHWSGEPTIELHGEGVRRYKNGAREEGKFHKGQLIKQDESKSMQHFTDLAEIFVLFWHAVNGVSN